MTCLADMISHVTVYSASILLYKSVEYQNICSNWLVSYYIMKKIKTIKIKCMPSNVFGQEYISASSKINNLLKDYFITFI